MRNQYFIDYAANTISITKRFAQAASKLGTPEFGIMLQLRQLGMTIRATPPKPHKAPKNTLTYAKMQKYMTCVADGETYLKDFAAIREASKVQSNPYQYVRCWFLKTFPNHAELPEFDENRKIVVTPANYDEEDQAS